MSVSAWFFRASGMAVAGALGLYVEGSQSPGFAVFGRITSATPPAPGTFGRRLQLALAMCWTFRSIVSDTGSPGIHFHGSRRRDHDAAAGVPLALDERPLAAQVLIEDFSTPRSPRCPGR